MMKLEVSKVGIDLRVFPWLWSAMLRVSKVMATNSPRLRSNRHLPEPTGRTQHCTYLVHVVRDAATEGRSLSVATIGPCGCRCLRTRSSWAKWTAIVYLSCTMGWWCVAQSFGPYWVTASCAAMCRVGGPKGEMTCTCCALLASYRFAWSFFKLPGPGGRSASSRDHTRI